MDLFPKVLPVLGVATIFFAEGAEKIHSSVLDLRAGSSPKIFQRDLGWAVFVKKALETFSRHTKHFIHTLTVY